MAKDQPLMTDISAERIAEPTDEMVEVCLQTFRREIDRHMDPRHPSSSPGHDSMRIALLAMFAKAARPSTSPVNLGSAADTIIAAIVEDIRGRCGLGDEWERIDVDARNHIFREWRRAIHAAMGKAK